MCWCFYPVSAISESWQIYSVSVVLHPLFFVALRLYHCSHAYRIASKTAIFQKHSKPRIILSTNVAETSLTVPGIRAVVDVGTARMSRYSVRSKVQRLPIEKISQASANQRMGRCGREAPGVCIRLYSEEDFDARAEFTEPEILRTNLSSVILQMASMRLGDINTFPFVEAPDPKFINDGYRTLQELAAIDDKRKLTKLGARLARLPVDPRLGRMLLAAADEGCVSEMLTIVSALSRTRPTANDHLKNEQHRMKCMQNLIMSNQTSWHG